MKSHTNRKITALSYSCTTFMQKNREKGKVQAARMSDNNVRTAPQKPCPESELSIIRKRLRMNFLECDTVKKHYNKFDDRTCEIDAILIMHFGYYNVGYCCSSWISLICIYFYINTTPFFQQRINKFYFNINLNQTQTFNLILFSIVSRN